MSAEVVTAELLPLDETEAGAAVAVREDEATAAVLAALDQAATAHLDAARPYRTRTGYARDWQLWCEFLDWLAPRTGHRLPDTAVQRGSLVSFVVWLDEVKQAAPNTINRRITGVTVEARARGVDVPKEATKAAREALRRIRADETRAQRGRGKAVSATPEHLRAMATAPADRPKPPGGGRRRGTQRLPELARLRDRALITLAFAIAGRSSEVAALDVDGIRLVAEGLEVRVPSVKGRPSRTVPVRYGSNPDTCPVRCWLAWKEAAGLSPGDPAFLPVDQVGRLGAHRLSPDACRLVITRAARRAGLDVHLTGHSARRGLVTTGRKRGKRVEKLRAQGGWSPSSPVFWEYVDEGERWEDAATEDIGL
ncbi:tyrosine-type recombinase/integrase [Streptomyces thermoalcalitolerans]|uniref:Site-specific integrase n=1 Tax=Streptomyces thermoalcalitolerans TaxID=65605 RepID=A0ABP3ZR45_9ACTN